MAETNTKKVPLWRKSILKKTVYIILWALVATIGYLWMMFWFQKETNTDFVGTLHGLIVLSIGIILFPTAVALTALGQVAFWTRLIGFLFFPFSIPFLIYSFALEAFDSTVKIAKRAPWKIVYFVMLSCGLIIGFFDANAVALMVARAFLWPVLFANLFTCVRWTLNPLPFLKNVESIAPKIVSVALESVAKSIKKDQPLNVAEEIVKVHAEKTLTQFLSITAIGESIAAWLKSSSLILTLFLVVFAYVVSTTIVVFAALYRITHHLAPTGAFTGALFTDSIGTYFYISAREFMGGQPYGIDFISSDLFLPLTFQSLSQFFLLSVVILTFSTVTTARSEQLFDNLQKSSTKAGEDLKGKFSEQGLSEIIRSYSSEVIETTVVKTDPGSSKK